MSTADQLIAKAMSTTSEDEAIACLRMARKKGGYVTKNSSQQVGEVTYNGHTAKYWYEKALAYYKYYQQTGNSLDNRTLKYAYDSLETQYKTLLSNEYSLKRENRNLRASNSIMKVIIGVSAVVVVSAGMMMFNLTF